MCVNRFEYRPKNFAHSLVLNCGKCPACLQSKANYRAFRIFNTISSNRDLIFVTLTYKNDFIPYINIDDLESRFIPVYRNNSTRLVKVGKTSVAFKTFNNKMVLDIIQPNFDKNNISENEYFKILNSSKFKHIRHFPSNLVSIPYYKDLQDFLKRLKINIQRNDTFPSSFNIKFYACSEIGPTTGRAHFHVLFSIPKGFFTQFKTAVCKAWPYADFRRTWRNIEFAKKPAQYIASYVNGNNVLPLLFQSLKEFKPKHSYSQDFGMEKNSFDLYQIMAKVRDGNLRYFNQRIREGVSYFTADVFPKYVINRFFPKFKGYNRFTRNEIQRIIHCPSELYSIAYRKFGNHKIQASLDKDCIQYYHLGDLDKIVRMLENKKEECFKKLYNYYGNDWLRFVLDYSNAYSNVWPLYYSERLKDFYNFDCDIQYKYDNFKSVVYGEIRNDTILNNIDVNSLDIDCLNDFNKNPYIIVQTRDLEDKYEKLDKSRKFKYSIYAQYHDDF